MKTVFYFYYNIMSISGGVKVKKQVDDTNYLQESINKKLYEIVNMNSFKKEKTEFLTANTYNMICPNCKTKDKIHAETVQTRASDEASDRFCKCLECGYEWKVSGSTV